MAIGKMKRRRKTTTRRRKKVSGIGAGCSKKTYKSPAAAKGAASAFRSVLPKSAKVSVKGKSVIVCK